MQVELYIFILFIVQTGINMLSTEDDDNWPNKSPHWNSPFLNQNLFLNKNFTKLTKTKVDEIETNTKKSSIQFPIETVKCSELLKTISKEQIEKNINNAYPLIHECSLNLLIQFISHKRRFASIDIERQMFENVTLVDYINRLLTKRAVSFSSPNDNYLLRDGTKGSGQWETIGKGTETPPLVFENYLSYEELKLSAHLSVSSPSCFFRTNNSSTEPNGVVFGGVGARLDKEYVMEYAEIIKSKNQNNHLHGYGRFFLPTLQGLFVNFFGDASLTYEEMTYSNSFTKPRYVKIDDNVYFDKLSYSKRIALTIDNLLIDANARAGKANQKAFIFVAGFGLDSWKIIKEQNEIFMDTVLKRTEFLGKFLINVSDLYFPQIFHNESLRYKSGGKILIEGHPLGGIEIEIGDRNPFDKLVGKHEGKLLIVSYNWNSNALPGNEFWLGNINENHDFGVAVSSQISELHNSLINPQIRAENLQVVTLQGIVSLEKYFDKEKDKKNI